MAAVVETLHRHHRRRKEHEPRQPELLASSVNIVDPSTPSTRGSNPAVGLTRASSIILNEAAQKNIVAKGAGLRLVPLRKLKSTWETRENWRGVSVGRPHGSGRPLRPVLVGG